MKTLIQTKYGTLQGFVKENTVCFYGIPYAQPPVGALRWTRPQPVCPWEGVRDCTYHRPACPQPGEPQNGLVLDEDCLYLNIWVPEKEEEERLPVFFWIHGGAFTNGTGSDPMHEGIPMGKHGVITVAINYRLGALGFFAHPELSAETEEGVSGNYGILDMIAALKWVKENIAAFGGDPNRITIAGQSAGGGAVGTLLESPLAAGLFTGAIIESGGPAIDKDSYTLPEAEEYGVAFLEAAGCKSLDELRMLPWRDLLKVRCNKKMLHSLGPHRPIIDGYVSQLQTYDAFMLGKTQDVPLLIGSTNFEGFMGYRGSDYAGFLAWMERYAPEAMEEMFALYPMQEREHKYWNTTMGRDKDFANLRLIAKVMSERGQRPVYHYCFAQLFETITGSFDPATHSAEIPYVFNKLHMQRDTLVLERHRKLADTIEAFWANFVKTGDPNGAELPKWPSYTKQTDLHMHFECGKTAAVTPVDPIRTAYHEKLLIDHLPYRKDLGL